MGALLDLDDVIENLEMKGAFEEAEWLKANALAPSVTDGDRFKPENIEWPGCPNTGPIALEAAQWVDTGNPHVVPAAAYSLFYLEYLAASAPVSGDREADLEGRLKAEEKACLEALEERDRMHEIADQLSWALGGGIEVIGEHSNANDPWQNALENQGEIVKRDKEIKRLRGLIEKYGHQALRTVLEFDDPANEPRGGSPASPVNGPDSVSGGTVTVDRTALEDVTMLLTVLLSTDMFHSTNPEVVSAHAEFRAALEAKGQGEG